MSTIHNFADCIRDTIKRKLVDAILINSQMNTANNVIWYLWIYNVYRTGRTLYGMKLAFVQLKFVYTQKKDIFLSSKKLVVNTYTAILQGNFIDVFFFILRSIILLNILFLCMTWKTIESP